MREGAGDGTVARAEERCTALCLDGGACNLLEKDHGAFSHVYESGGLKAHVARAEERCCFILVEGDAGGEECGLLEKDHQAFQHKFHSPREREHAYGFRLELQRLLNRCSMENGSDTPDFILAEYIMGCLNSFDMAVRKRSSWYRSDTGENNVPGG